MMNFFDNTTLFLPFLCEKQFGPPQSVVEFYAGDSTNSFCVLNRLYLHTQPAPLGANVRNPVAMTY